MGGLRRELNSGKGGGLSDIGISTQPPSESEVQRRGEERRGAVSEPWGKANRVGFVLRFSFDTYSTCDSGRLPRNSIHPLRVAALSRIG